MGGSKANNKRILKYAAIGFTVAVGCAFGVVIGWFSKGERESVTDGHEGHQPTPSPYDWTAQLLNEIKADKIKQNLRNMTLQPHLAGTEDNKNLAQKLVDQWRQMGLDEAQLVSYDVLLSYPGNKTNRNRAIIFDQNGNASYTTALEEKILDQDQNNSKVVPPFNAFSKGGPPIRSSKFYYVNYGRAEDFEYLERNKTVNFTGSIVIARYGKIFRGNKVAFAQRYGAIGIILYSDPADYAVGVNSTYDSTFPNSWWLPPSGVQRGTTFIGNGDPLTPGYPAKEGVYRLSVDELRQEGEIPNIPSHPIGYEDAVAFLGLLPGSDVTNSAWKGNLNVSYKYGGDLNGRYIELQVNNYEQVTTVYNAIGVIRGEIEPDRYVMLGNHRDAWIFGSIDPSSGTATLLEVTRAFSELRKKGWKPRRTIVFGSWDAEEYGLIGSNEWAEEFTKNLAQRAVAYLNVDIAVEYPYVLEATGSPLLHQALYSATRKVPSPPSEKFENVYEAWKSRSHDKTKTGMPLISQPGSGSDHASFYQTLGIPVVDMTYTFDTGLWKISGYPLYHSVYETFRLVEDFIDKDFVWHQSMGRLWAELARSLADADLIPFEPVDYTAFLQQNWEDFKEMHKDYLNHQAISRVSVLLDSAISEFTGQAANFTVLYLRNPAVRSDALSLRRVNDQLIQLERAFTDPAGLPGYPQRKHLLYSQSSRDTYSGSAFPGVADALYDIKSKSGTAAFDKALQETSKELSRVLFAVRSATSTLREFEKLFS